MERKDWEQKFSDKYIRPVLQQADAVIKDGNDMLLSDTRQGQSQLLNLVFEVGEQDSDPDTPLQHTAAAWKYRTCITVDHFFRQFQLHVQSNLDDSTNLPVLKLFFDESHHLRALYHVPDILALQRRVLQQFHHRLSRVEASQTTIKELLDAKENPELKRLVEAFSKAWDIVKDLLLSYRCRTAEGGLVQLPEECHTASVSENSPVGMLLPDTEGPGRCAYLLIHYLLVQHNHFLQRYCPHTRQTYDCLPEVPLHMITRRHLVSYSPQADLLPLVLAHCNYSLHLGHGDSATATMLEYDFQGFELQLKNSLLLSKSRVQRGEHGVMEIETMSYCADTTNSRLINRLREKIDQAPLDMRVQRQIASEFRESLPDICQSIDSINTTLTFLLTLRVTADQSLQAFMTDTLRMKDTGLHSRKAQQHCRVKHVQALWLLLCFQRARILATHNEEAFDDQGGDLRKELTEEQKEEPTVALRRLSPDRVELVSMQIYQCIVLHLIGHSKEDFVSPDNYDLKWLVCDSLENSLYSEATDESLQDQLTIADLERFPKAILASQSIPAWAYVLAHLTNRQ